MLPIRTLFPAGLLLLASACLGVRNPAPPVPDAVTARWRELIGCYRMEDGQFALDSVADLRLNADRPGVRRARFAPEPPIVGGYWFVTDRGAVWLVRHDGLWGRSYEFTQRGDSLVGRQWVRTDVPNAPNPATPALAVRTADCEVAPGPR